MRSRLRATILAMSRLTSFAPAVAAALLVCVRVDAGGAASSAEWLAVTGSVNAAGTNIELIALDRSRRLNLTRSRTANQQHPSWSPDGERLVFHGGRLPHITLYTIRADGSGLRRVLGTRSAYDVNPMWSPDGRWIGFVRGLSVGRNERTFLVHPDGSGLRRFTPRLTGTPSWSPDQRKIAFTRLFIRRRADGKLRRQREIFVVRADGTDLRRLTHSPKDDRDPAWSPDGDKIAFTTDRNARLAEQDDVYVMEADGSHQTRLTENQAPPKADASLGTDFGPTWSPDGSRIAFTSGRDGNFELYVMNADGTCETRLTNTPSNDETDATWRPTPNESGAGRIRC